jgi:acetyl esterase/lipase
MRPAYLFQHAGYKLFLSVSIEDERRARRLGMRQPASAHSAIGEEMSNNESRLKGSVAATCDASITDHLLALVDPELRSAALHMRQMTEQFTPMSEQKLSVRRTLLASMVVPLVPDVAVTQHRIKGVPDSPEVGVYVVNAQPGACRPGILHMHGGGFTSSSARSSVPLLQETAQAIDCTIVSVDFRNAPETRYEGSLEDNYAALRWMQAHAEELGIDDGRIALMGESGGGGHAALLAIAARDRGEIPVLFQMLIYPMIDDRTGSSRPMPSHLGAFGWNADANRFGWRCFLGQEPGTDDVPATAVPARVTSVAGLPPTFIGVGALDIFVDENIAYARRLIEAGIATELVVVPGAFHGFDMIARTSAAARRFTAAKLDALRRAFAITKD